MRGARRQGDGGETRGQEGATAPGYKARADEAYFRRLVECAPDVVLRYDLLPQRRLTYISPAVERLLGYAPNEVLADPNFFLTAIETQDYPRLDAALAQVAATGMAAPLMTVRCRHRNGDTIWLELAPAPILEADHTVTAIGATARDVSRHTQLVALLAERSRLADAIAAARVAVHELGNILTPLVGFAELLSLQPEVSRSETAAGYAGRIARAGQEASAKFGQLQRIIRQAGVPAKSSAAAASSADLPGAPG